MKTTWDNYKSLTAAKRQAAANKKRGNTWTHIRQRINGRFALETSPGKQTVFSA
jgi:hypothetical protein